MKRSLTVAFCVLIVGFGWMSFFESIRSDVSLLPKSANAAPQVLTDTIEIQIVGGGPADAEEYPWMVAAKQFSKNLKNIPICEIDNSLAAGKKFKICFNRF